MSACSTVELIDGKHGHDGVRELRTVLSAGNAHPCGFGMSTLATTATNRRWIRTIAEFTDSGRHPSYLRVEVSEHRFPTNGTFGAFIRLGAVASRARLFNPCGRAVWSDGMLDS